MFSLALLRIMVNTGRRWRALRSARPFSASDVAGVTTFPVTAIVDIQY